MTIFFSYLVDEMGKSTFIFIVRRKVVLCFFNLLNYKTHALH